MDNIPALSPKSVYEKFLYIRTQVDNICLLIKKSYLRKYFRAWRYIPAMEMT